MGAEPKDDRDIRPGWVLLPTEAKHRGFKSTLSFRRWCKRNGVPIRRSGRLEVVCPAEVDAIILRMKQPSNDPIRMAAEASVTRSLSLVRKS